MSATFIRNSWQLLRPLGKIAGSVSAGMLNEVKGEPRNQGLVMSDWCCPAASRFAFPRSQAKLPSAGLSLKVAEKEPATICLLVAAAIGAILGAWLATSQ